MIERSGHGRGWLGPVVLLVWAATSLTSVEGCAGGCFTCNLHLDLRPLGGWSGTASCDSGCPPGERCFGSGCTSICGRPCAEDDDCSTGQVCVERWGSAMCQPGCGDDHDCSPCERCTPAGACVACDGDYRCDERIGLCEPVTHACTNDVDCEGWQACADTEEGLRCVDLGPAWLSTSACTTGARHTCCASYAAVGGFGTYCFGASAEGQLGLESLAPLGVVFEPSDLRAEGDATCSEHQCVGRNDFGQLDPSAGAPTWLDAWTPLGGAGASFEIVGVGTSRSCGASGGVVTCFGEPGALVGEHVLATSQVTKLVVGHDHACAETPEGVWCFGEASLGRLGGLTSPTLHPTFVAPAAFRDSTCALEPASGSVYCWGDGSSGQLGDGGLTLSSSTPVWVLGGASRLALGDGFACAGHDEQVRCWGRNERGQLGRGLTSATLEPPDQDVALSPAQWAAASTWLGSLTAGEAHTCAAVGTTSPFAFCWGSNEHGALHPSVEPSHPSPVMVLAP
jgi:hypothetical protein